MKKTMIAMAVAGVVAAPVAMAGVEIGGELRFDIVDNDAGTSMDNNKSILFVKGSEDLGNGMKAGFFSKMTGIGSQGSVNSSDTYVNLSGSMGKIQFGSFPIPSRDVVKMAEMNPWKEGALGVFAHDGSMPAQHIQYTSPTMSGVTVKASVVSGTKTGGSQTDLDGHVSNVGVYYSNGPLAVSVATLNDNDGNNDTTSVGAKYTMGDLKFAVAYEDVDNLRDATAVAASYNMGGGNSVSVVNESDSTDTTSEKTVVTFNHAFSKRTRAYLTFVDPKTGGDDKTVVGIKHKF